MPLDQLLEAILFWKAEPLSVAKLAIACGQSEGEIIEALNTLEHSLAGRGIRLLRHHDAVSLGTAPAASALIERLTKEELARDLGRAGLETLTIVLYRGSVTRTEIDYLRGVNSSFILRNLQVRGLVERVVDPEDARRFLYQPTFELLQYLGLTKIEDLPEREAVLEKIKQL